MFEIAFKATLGYIVASLLAFAGLLGIVVLGYWLFSHIPLRKFRK